MLKNALKSRLYYSFFIIGLSASVVVSAAAVTATRITLSSGNKQEEKVNTTLPKPFVVRVTNNSGKAVAGAKVQWDVTEGGGSFPKKSTTTNSDGVTSNTLTLGKVSGHNQATAILASTGAAAVMGATGSPGPAETIALYSGNDQTGTAGASLSKDLQVICKDKYGNGASHTTVNWTVVSGGGSVPYAYSESEAGIATKALTLGKTPGLNYAKATIDGTSKSFTFTATGVPGAVAAIQIVSGNHQTGSANTPLASPLVASPVDSHGNRVDGVTLHWTADTAGDSFSARSTVTNSSGLASNTLKLGSTSLLHTATATIPGTSISITFTATMGVNGVVTVGSAAPSNPQAFKPYFLGLSYMKDAVSTQLFNADNLKLVKLFKNLGPGVLRLNAEEPFQPIIWDEGGPGLDYGTLSKVDLVRLEKFLKAVDWKVLYGIGFAQNTSAKAASEAGVAAAVFGDSLLGFEIGNEPDVYHEAVYGDPKAPQIPKYTWDDFMSTKPVYASDGKLLPSWPIFASAIRAAAPKAALTGPSAGFDWFMSFAESSEASKLSLLTRHVYQGENTSVLNMTTLLTPDPRYAVQFPKMAEAAKAANVPGGYRVSECNTYSTPIDGVTNATGAALWTLDFLFTNARYQSTGVEFMGGGEGENFSPILDNGSEVTAVGPDYYALFAYAQLIKGGKLMNTKVTPAPSTFSAYAIQEPDGSTDFVLNNKSATAKFTVGLEIPDTASATSLLLTGPSLTATSGFTFGGSAIDTDGAWEATATKDLPIEEGSAVVTVPAASAQIVHVQ